MKIPSNVHWTIKVKQRKVMKQKNQVHRQIQLTLIRITTLTILTVRTITLKKVNKLLLIVMVLKILK